ncbi:hypothetical protein [Salinivibrio phage SMHB1]|uniref:Uncharacterized protein n=1 Tax=Salinivibrio phage SMHB1 TaxID=1897436 RepID=A0A1D9C9P8_9CAUD|nr:hypothetical protein HOR26_gp07 [Salinivibrio phage SMHB1]AOY11812.1 hypothetical protein [Salinivibrio phage SMHB1]
MPFLNLFNSKPMPAIRDWRWESQTSDQPSEPKCPVWLHIVGIASVLAPYVLI